MVRGLKIDLYFLLYAFLAFIYSAPALYLRSPSFLSRMPQGNVPAACCRCFLQEDSSCPNKHTPDTPRCRYYTNYLQETYLLLSTSRWKASSSSHNFQIAIVLFTSSSAVHCRAFHLLDNLSFSRCKLHTASAYRINLTLTPSQ